MRLLTDSSRWPLLSTIIFGSVWVWFLSPLPPPPTSHPLTLWLFVKFNFNSRKNTANLTFTRTNSRCDTRRCCCWLASTRRRRRFCPAPLAANSARMPSTSRWRFTRLGCLLYRLSPFKRRCCHLKSETHRRWRDSIWPGLMRSHQSGCIRKSKIFIVFFEFVQIADTLHKEVRGHRSQRSCSVLLLYEGHEDGSR